jgi:heat shock protein HslJ
MTLLVCGTAFLLATCEPRAREPKASPRALSAPLGPPTLEELKNATFAGLEDIASPVTLEDGRWEGEPYEPGAASRPSVSLASGFVLTGDLDADGALEAVVVLVQSSGGSGTFDYVAVVKRTPEGLRNVATTALGDRVGIRSARVEGGKLLVSVVRAGEKDAMCCPGELADLGWTLAAGKLSLAATAPVTGRLSLDTLAGTEWVLRAWDLAEPAPAEPEVTLAYQNDRIAGTSGCNRYTAAATAGDSAGELAIGPAAGTRMACPEPASAVETRFLKQIRGARKFGFRLGRLAVGYEKDGGAYGTMLFEGRTPAGAKLRGSVAAAGFDQRLELQGITFRVTCPNDRSQPTVTITPSGLAIDNSAMAREADGHVVLAEAADLNVDGSPEIYVYAQSAGSGSYGSLVAFSANRKRSLSEIYLPPIADDPKASKGYLGHDEFRVVESTLVRRFPVYRDGDTNSKPTGGTRQIQYKLTKGEAGFVLRADKVVDY